MNDKNNTCSLGTLDRLTRERDESLGEIIAAGRDCAHHLLHDMAYDDLVNFAAQSDLIEQTVWKEKLYPVVKEFIAKNQITFGRRIESRLFFNSIWRELVDTLELIDSPADLVGQADR